MLTQNFINIIVLASGYTLIGVSFLIVFRIQGFLDVTQAIPFTFAPYVTLTLIEFSDLDLISAATAGILGGGLISYIINRFIFFPLRSRKASPLIMLLAALGIYTIFKNTASLLFGDNPVSILRGSPTRNLALLDGTLTPWQLLSICWAIIIVSVTALILKLTKTGTAYRAVVADRELADISGVLSTNILIQFVVLGSLIAGLAGILVGIDTGVDPAIGLHALLMGAVVAVVGGGRRIEGVVVVSVLIAFGQVVGTWRTSALWQDSIAFIILLAFLILRPEGIIANQRNRMNA